MQYYAVNHIVYDFNRDNFRDIEHQTSMLMLMMIQKKGTLHTFGNDILLTTMQRQTHARYEYSSMILSVWTQFRPLFQYNGNLIASSWNCCRKYVCTMQSQNMCVYVCLPACLSITHSKYFQCKYFMQ